MSSCPQVTHVGDLLWRGCKLPRLVWAEGYSPRQSGPGLFSCGKKSVPFGCIMCVLLHAHLLKRLGLSLPPLFLPSRSLVFSWQTDSKGTPSLAHRSPEVNTLPHRNQHQLITYHTQCFLTYAKVPL